MISKEEVLQLAELARLKLDESEVAGVQKDISNILEYVGQISAVQGDPEGQQAAYGAGTSQRNSMREDVSTAALGAREELLKAFPKREGDYNVVRKIIQKDEPR